MHKSVILFLYSVVLTISLCCCSEADDDKSTLQNESETALAHPEDQKKREFSSDALALRFMGERRIYIIDLTKSMEGFNGAENIFGKVKELFSEAINEINDTVTEIVIIPFTDKPLGVYRNNTNHKDEIIDYINNLESKRGDTNILEAWTEGLEYLDDSKINYMFLLTDGVHNYGEPIEQLYNTLNDWHKHVEGKYEFAFYVLLSSNAKEAEICRIVDESKQMWLVPSLNIMTDFIVGNINLSVNIRNTNHVSMHLKCTNPQIFNNGFKFRLSLPENNFYRIVDSDETIDENGNIKFTIEKLKPQMELPIEFKTKILIDYDKEKFPFVFFTPEEYNLNIINVGTRSMSVKKIKE